MVPVSTASCANTAAGTASVSTARSPRRASPVTFSPVFTPPRSPRTPRNNCSVISVSRWPKLFRRIHGADVIDDPSADHRQHRLDVLDLIRGNREVVAIQHDEIRELARLNRAE